MDLFGLKCVAEYQKTNYVMDGPKLCFFILAPDHLPKTK